MKKLIAFSLFTFLSIGVNTARAGNTLTDVAIGGLVGGLVTHNLGGVVAGGLGGLAVSQINGDVDYSVGISVGSGPRYGGYGYPRYYSRPYGYYRPDAVHFRRVVDQARWQLESRSRW